MSRVYLVEHPILPMKRVLKEDSGTKQSREALCREAEVLLNINDPHFPGLYDLIEEDDHVILIEEYMEGMSLRTYMFDHKHLTEEEICRIGAMLCEAISVLHRKEPPIFYLDFKPEHMILTGAGIRLIDLGAACRATDASMAPYYATLPYAAPELVKGQSRSERSDIYGIGTILYEMKYGVPFAEGATFSRGKLDQVIRKATESNPVDRQSDIFQLKKDLEQLQNNTISIERGETPLSQIVVIGSGSRIGTTHFAIHLTVFLNRTGQKACYYSEQSINPLCAVEQFVENAVCEEGRVFVGEFTGDTLFRKDRFERREEIQVIDGGRYRKEIEDRLEEAERVFVLLGAKPWEQEETQAVVRALQGLENVQFVVNYCDEATFRSLCRRYRISAARFPLSGNVFTLTREERPFFTAIWNKKRKG